MIFISNNSFIFGIVAIFATEKLLCCRKLFVETILTARYMKRGKRHVAQQPPAKHRRSLLDVLIFIRRNA